MSSFFSPYRHQFIRVGACVPHVAVAEPAHNGDAVEALLAEGDAGARRADGIPRTVPLGLRDRRFVVSGCAARCGREPNRPPGPGQPRPVPGVCRRRAAALVRPSLQLRHRDPSRPAARRRPEGLSAELPRVLRAPAFHLGHRRRRPVDRRRRAQRPVRRRPAVRRRRCCGFHLSRRNLRGFVGAAAAEQRGGVGRRRDPAQSVGQQHHDRQGADAPAVCAPRNRRAASPPTPIPPPAPASRRPTSPGTARPGSSSWARAGRDRAVLGDARDGDRRCRSRAHSPGADADQHLRRLRARRGRPGTPFRTIGFDF